MIAAILISLCDIIPNHMNIINIMFLMITGNIENLLIMVFLDLYKNDFPI